MQFEKGFTSPQSLEKLIVFDGQCPGFPFGHTGGLGDTLHIVLSTSSTWPLPVAFHLTLIAQDTRMASGDLAGAGWRYIGSTAGHHLVHLQCDGMKTPSLLLDIRGYSVP